MSSPTNTKLRFDAAWATMQQAHENGCYHHFFAFTSKCPGNGKRGGRGRFLLAPSPRPIVTSPTLMIGSSKAWSTDSMFNRHEGLRISRRRWVLTRSHGTRRIGELGTRGDVVTTNAVVVALGVSPLVGHRRRHAPMGLHCASLWRCLLNLVHLVVRRS